jgi:hypothetical protein
MGFTGFRSSSSRRNLKLQASTYFEGNKIKEAWTVADGLTAALQLGVVKIESSSSR